MPSIWAVPLAGGGGTRLWPVSREATPKQFQRLAGPVTLMEATLGRGLMLTDREHVVVVTSRDAAARLSSIPAFKQIPIIAKPEGRNTAPAIGLAAAYIAARDANAVMAVFPCDHHIENEGEFGRVLSVACDAAAEYEKVVLVGVKPTGGNDQLGHIRRGKPAGGKCAAFVLEEFREKPPMELAVQFAESGEWFWNAGMFVGRAVDFLANISEQLPKLGDALARIAGHLGTSKEAEALASAYAEIESAQIDKAVHEKIPGRLLVVCDDGMGWTDIGNFAELSKYHGADERGNRVRQGDAVFSGGTCDCFVSGDSNQTVILHGVEGLTVVSDGNALLIIPTERAREVGDIVKQLRQAGRKDLL